MGYHFRILWVAAAFSFAPRALAYEQEPNGWSGFKWKTTLTAFLKDKNVRKVHKQPQKIEQALAQRGGIYLELAGSYAKIPIKQVFYFNKDQLLFQVDLLYADTAAIGAEDIDKIKGELIKSFGAPSTDRGVFLNWTGSITHIEFAVQNPLQGRSAQVRLLDPTQLQAAGPEFQMPPLER